VYNNSETLWDDDLLGYSNYQLLREPSRHYSPVSFLKPYDITCYSRTFSDCPLPFLGPHLEVLALYMFVFAVLRQDDISLFLHQPFPASAAQVTQTPSNVRDLTYVAPYGKMGGIAALADVVKSEAEYASLISNQRLSSPPHGRCLSATTNSRGNISRRECGSLVREGGV
jgi:hypothetical protein